MILKKNSRHYCQKQKGTEPMNMKTKIKYVAGLLIVSICFSLFSFSVTAINDNNGVEENEFEINSVDMPDEEIYVESDSDGTSRVPQMNGNAYRNNVINGSVEIDCSHEELIAAIKSSNEFNINGRITNNDHSIDLKGYYDFSQIDKYSIADWAYRNGLISLKEKMDCYCDLYLSRNFDHIFCLNSINEEISNYQSNCQQFSDINLKIEQLLSGFHQEKEQQLRSSSLSTTNFYIVYTGSDTYNLNPIGNYLEQIRTEYHNLGFLYPRNNNSITDPSNPLYHKLLVYLHPGNNHPSGVTTSINIIGNNSASIIEINDCNYSDINEVKDVIDHEYFHAIQNTYNYQASWFCEACATWGAMVVGADSDCFKDHVNYFIRNYCSSTSMSSTNGYGASVYPLAIHRRDGGANAIKTFYENYSNQSVTNDTAVANSIIRLVINNSLSTQNDSFETVYRAMCGYLFYTNEWYDMIYANAINWEMHSNLSSDDHSVELFNVSSFPTDADKKLTNDYSYRFPSSSGSTAQLDHLTNYSFVLSFPSGFKGTAKIEVSYSDSNGKTQIYFKNATTHNHYIKFPSTGSNGLSTYYLSEIGTNIDFVGVNVANVSDSGSITYSIKVTLYPLSNELNICNHTSYLYNTRYAERVIYLDCGESANFMTTFSTSGSKMIQTLGSNNTRIRIFEPTNDGNYNDSPLYDSDNGTPATNAFLRVSLQDGIQYKIQVSFKNTQTSGYTKLVITPTTWLIKPGASSISSFSDIWTASSTNYTLNTSTTTNQVKVLVFTPPSTGSYTIATTGNIDTYLYVIDAQSTDIIEQNIDYNDDGGSGNNAQLTKAFTAGKQYLIFYSAYNIFQNNSTYVGSTTLTIVKN